MTFQDEQLATSTQSLQQPVTNDKLINLTGKHNCIISKMLCRHWGVVRPTQGLKPKLECYLRKFWVFAEQLKQAEVQCQVRGGKVCILTAVKHTG